VVRRRWTDAEITRKLKADARRRKRLPTVDDWRKATRSRPSARTVISRFGSWPAALEAADLKPTRRCPEQPWTPERILEALRVWHREHGRWPTSLEWKHAADERPCTGTVARVNGSWRRAIAAAQDPEQPGHQLDDDVRRAVEAALALSKPDADRLSALLASLEALRERYPTTASKGRRGGLMAMPSDVDTMMLDVNAVPKETEP
jgi:hypothetical protein